MKRLFKIIVALAIIISLLATIKIKTLGSPITNYDFGTYLAPSNYDTTKDVQLTFLGTSGFVINYKGKKIITDPYFSNPDVFKNFVKKLQFPKLSDNILPRSVYENANTIVISHGHYDHCLNIENFLTKGVPTKIIAEQHITNEINSVKNNFDVQFENDMQSYHYSADSTFRIFPLNSPHSPHFAGITLFTGLYKEPLAHLPERFWKWKLHGNYSYLIDIMEKDSIVYRCLFLSGNIADASVEKVKELCKNKNVDIALQIFWKEKACMPGLNKVYAAGKPKKIILHHWNNFFKPYDKNIEVMRDTHLDKVLKRLNKEGKSTQIMLPFSSISFDIDN